MEERKLIIAELAGNCPELVKLDPAMPFHLPNDYFKGLPSHFIRLIRNQQSIEDSPLIQGTDISEELPLCHGTQTVDSVVEELNSISPLLAQIQQQASYQIPNNYFEQQHWTSIASKGTTAVNIPKTPIIGWRHTKKLLNYAAAAILAGLLITSAFLFSDKNAQSASKGLSDNELLGISEMPNESLENYLLDHAYLETHDLQETADWTELDELHQSVSTLTDEELETYLSQNSINQ